MEEIKFVFSSMDEYTIRKDGVGDTIMGRKSHDVMYYFFRNKIEKNGR